MATIKKTITISVDPDIEEYVVAYAKKMGSSKSAAINFLINQARQYNASVESIPALINTINQINLQQKEKDLNCEE